MTWVSLQMISLGSLLIFNDHTSLSSSSSSAAAAARCISEKEASSRAANFHSHWVDLRVDKVPPQRDAETCAQMAKEAASGRDKRSLSPWTYRMDQDVNRIPRDISIAKCLCEGCIINQREDLSYNSVPVYAQVMVLKKTQCKNDPSKYQMKKHLIEVAVACTCVVPKSFSN